MTGGGYREERFTALYEATSAAVARYALRHAPSADDAADCVAETFLIAWTKLESVPEGDPSVPWLLATARNVLANQGRKRQRLFAAVTRMADEFRLCQGRAETDSDESAATRAAFVALSLQDREILALAGWEGLDAAGIATVLGCSPTAARVRLHRARSRFSMHLESNDKVIKTPPAAGHPLAEKE